MRDGALEDPDVAQALAVRAAVAALPDKQRTALVCRHHLALSVPEGPGVIRASG